MEHQEWVSIGAPLHIGACSCFLELHGINVGSSNLQQELPMTRTRTQDEIVSPALYHWVISIFISSQKLSAQSSPFLFAVRPLHLTLTLWRGTLSGLWRWEAPFTGSLPMAQTRRRFRGLYLYPPWKKPNSKNSYIKLDCEVVSILYLGLVSVIC